MSIFVDAGKVLSTKVLEHKEGFALFSFGKPWGSPGQPIIACFIQIPRLTSQYFSPFSWNCLPFLHLELSRMTGNNLAAPQFHDHVSRKLNISSARRNTRRKNLPQNSSPLLIASSCYQRCHRESPAVFMTKL
jgi:hypothetical protein